MKTKTWTEIKDNVYGKKGTERRDELERDFESFKIGLLLKKAREEKKIDPATAWKYCRQKKDLYFES